eukprot:gene6458-7122_t
MTSNVEYEIEALLQQAMLLQRQQTSHEMELKHLKVLENKLNGDLATLLEKLKSLRDQLSSIMREASDMEKTNSTIECELQVQREASIRMAQSIQPIIQYIQQLKEQIEKEQLAYDTEYETWLTKLKS